MSFLIGKKHHNLSFLNAQNFTKFKIYFKFFEEAEILLVFYIDVWMTIIFTITYKGLLGLVHVYSLPSQVLTHFWTFERKQLTIIFAHFKYIFLGIETLWLVVLGKIIEIKLALEIIIKMEQVDSFYLGKWTNCCLLTPGIVKYMEYLWYS